MNGATLRAIAAEYAAEGLSTIVAAPRSKVPLVEWKAYQYVPPSTLEREAMFSIEDQVNIGVVCGAASKNLIVIDAESKRTFETQLKRCEGAGVANTWIDETSRGGHIFAYLPIPVKPKCFKRDGFEVRAQGQFVLMPPSVHPTGAVYRFINRPPSIIRIPSLDAVDWLKLQPAPKKEIPRKAKYLLQGDPSHYNSRSEAEQAIVTVLFNAGFCFDEMLAVFKSYPAIGKFREIETTKGAIAATSWLRTCFENAKTWCAIDSPARKLARSTQWQAETVPWPGRTGSTDRAVLLAHLNIAHRASVDVYHASARDLAEIAGCTRVTASKATRRLQEAGHLELVTAASFPFANRYRLPEKVNFDPLPHMVLHGMDRTSSFLLPDAFRQGGLGRSAFEGMKALEIEPLRAKEITLRTGRHIQTIRKSLTRLRDLGYVRKTMGKWQGMPIIKIDLYELASQVGMKGARKRQRDQHKAERLRRTITMKLLQGCEIEAGQQ